MRRMLGCLASLAVVACASPPPTLVVDADGKRFEVEVAATADQQRQGLSHRVEVAPGTGMLFLFPPTNDPDTHQSPPISVTMAGMLVDLDVAWIRKGRVISTQTLPICAHTEPTSCPSWASPGAVDALLEVASGDLAHITPNASIATVSADGVLSPVGGTK